MFLNKIRCVDGPCDGMTVEGSLGYRWPYILLLNYGDPHVLVGHYQYEYVTYVGDRYYWEGTTEEWYLPGLGKCDCHT